MSLKKQGIKNNLIKKSVRCKLAGCDKPARVKFCCDDHKARHRNINKYARSLYKKIC
jgi:hypothetical protein